MIRAIGKPARARRGAAGAALVAAGALLLAACGSSSKSSSSASSAPASTSASTSASPASSQNAAFTVKTASVAGVGTVLVNGDGKTLYLLTSEKGGKLTCTDASGCTKVWPDTELPKGTTQGVASGGAKTSLLGTVKSAEGHLYLTYGGWPLYTFSGDSAAGQAHGQGIHSFGGTWYVLSAAGTAATKPASSQSAPMTTSSSSSGGGYGY